VLGFLDLQAGRAQSRFYTELENWLSSVTDVGSDIAPVADTTRLPPQETLERLTDQLTRMNQDGATNMRTTAAMASLAEGIQGLVKNMRGEQQMLRDWIEAQQEESRAMRKTLEKLSTRIGEPERGASERPLTTAGRSRSDEAGRD
jgi:TolA-binding protein